MASFGLIKRAFYTRGIWEALGYMLWHGYTTTTTTTLTTDINLCCTYMFQQFYNCDNNTSQNCIINSIFIGSVFDPNGEGKTLHQLLTLQPLIL